MRNIIAKLEKELELKRAALQANTQAKEELLSEVKAIGIENSDSDVFADNYARIFKNNIALTSCIADLEQAIFYASRAIKVE